MHGRYWRPANARCHRANSRTARLLKTHQPERRRGGRGCSWRAEDCGCTEHRHARLRVDADATDGATTASAVVVRRVCLSGRAIERRVRAAVAADRFGAGKAECGHQGEPAALSGRSRIRVCVATATTAAVDGEGSVEPYDARLD